MKILDRLVSRLQAGDTRAERLYQTAVEQARVPDFYQNGGVADSVRGRFELICLHVFLVFRRLKACDQPGRKLAQALHDVMFADMDRSLRELGIGDMSVGKRVKQLATNLYGRIKVYEDGLATGDADLGKALRRNLYGGEEPSAAQVAGMVAYIHTQDRYLATQDCAAIISGSVDFCER